MGRSQHEGRRAAAELFARGVNRAEAARRLGVSRATATRWFRLWRAGGARSLLSPVRRGRPPKLSPNDLEVVHEALTASPERSGFPLERWSLAAVAALIERTTGVAYHPRHLGRMLRRSGWVVPPFGECAAYGFRQLPYADPDGNAILLRRTAEGG